MKRHLSQTLLTSALLACVCGTGYAQSGDVIQTTATLNVSAEPIPFSALEIQTLSPLNLGEIIYFIPDENQNSRYGIAPTGTMGYSKASTSYSCDSATVEDNVDVRATKSAVMALVVITGFELAPVQLNYLNIEGTAADPYITLYSHSAPPFSSLLHLSMTQGVVGENGAVDVQSGNFEPHVITLSSGQDSGLGSNRGNAALCIGGAVELDDHRTGLFSALFTIDATYL